MTTFIATPFNHVFTRTRFHPFSESVYFASLSLFGLISLFHFFSLKLCGIIPQIKSFSNLFYRYLIVLSNKLSVYSHR